MQDKFKIGILVISDSSFQGTRKSSSEPVIKHLLKKIGTVVSQSIVPDEVSYIVREIKKMVDEMSLDIIITTGGTGLSPRDNTPEATRKVIDKEVPGIAELMRLHTFNISPRSVLSRGVVGIRKTCLIINLPGSVKAVEECLRIILPVIAHAVEIIQNKVTRCGG